MAINVTAKMFTIKNHIPGRLRLKIPAIRFSNARANILEDQRLRHELVNRAEARPKSGSLILLVGEAMTRFSREPSFKIYFGETGRQS